MERLSVYLSEDEGRTEEYKKEPRSMNKLRENKDRKHT